MAMAMSTWRRNTGKHRVAWMLLGAAAGQAQPQARAGPYHPPGHSTLVHVLLWEGEVDAAWRAAQHGGCAEGLASWGRCGPSANPLEE